MAMSAAQNGRTLHFSAFTHGAFGPLTLALPPGTHACLLAEAGTDCASLLNAMGGRGPHGGTIRLGEAEGPAVGRAGIIRAWPAPRFARLRGGQARAAASRWLDDAAGPAEATTLPLRRALAVALGQRPRVLLLDRPLDAMADPAPGLGLLRALGADGLILLHATARPAIALAAAERILLLEGGRIGQIGSPAELYESPASPIIARRTGPASFLPGTWLGAADDIGQVRLAAGPVVEVDPPAPALAEGAACQVMLRPEHVAVSAMAAADLAGAVAAVLRDVMHRGDRIQLVAAIGTDTLVSVTRPAMLGLRGLSRGQNISLAWQPRHARVFAA